MKKLAIFVEGFTEVRFVERLVREIAGANNVVVHTKAIRGGSAVKRSIRAIDATKSATDEKFYVLIYDCGSDVQVKTRIVEEHQGLTAKGYSGVIGIRDVRPEFTFDQIPKLELGLRYRIKTSLIPVEFILAVMEIEAWFLAEHTHFQRIHPTLSRTRVETHLGIDLEGDDLGLRQSPARDLASCYQLAGLDYAKGSVDVVVAALDLDYVCLEMTNRIPYLRRLTSSIESFLS